MGIQENSSGSLSVRPVITDAAFWTTYTLPVDEPAPWPSSYALAAAAAWGFGIKISQVRERGCPEYISAYGAGDAPSPTSSVRVSVKPDVVIDTAGTN